LLLALAWFFRGSKPPIFQGLGSTVTVSAAMAIYSSVASAAGAYRLSSWSGSAPLPTRLAWCFGSPAIPFVWHAVGVFTAIIRIRSAKQKPNDAFITVQYRNNWFWIDDDDVGSKAAFAQLMGLFAMIDTGSRGNLLVVTIPAHP
jgi:hypothetical protein